MNELMKRHSEETNVGDIERWASLVGGSLLSFYGLRRALAPLALLGVGAYLIYRGSTGHCLVYSATGVNTTEGYQGLSKYLPNVRLPGGGKVDIEQSITVNKPTSDVYRYWRNLENLPRFMRHLEVVKELGEKRSHWVARAPLSAEWDAVITEERQDQLIAWRSLPGSEVDTHGSVRFKEAPDGRGTEVHVNLSYSPPAGALGTAVARVMRFITAQEVKQDLRRFKQMLETGETATVEGQPSGRVEMERQRPSRPIRAGDRTREDVVEQASEESFPASDAPGWIKRSD